MKHETKVQQAVLSAGSLWSLTVRAQAVLDCIQDEFFKSTPPYPVKYLGELLMKMSLKTRGLQRLLEEELLGEIARKAKERR